MANWVEVIANKLNNPSSIPRACTVEDKNQLLHSGLWPPYTHHGMYTYVHTFKYTVACDLGRRCWIKVTQTLCWVYYIFQLPGFLVWAWGCRKRQGSKKEVSWGSGRWEKSLAFFTTLLAGALEHRSQKSIGTLRGRFGKVIDTVACESLRRGSQMAALWEVKRKGWGKTNRQNNDRKLSGSRETHKTYRCEKFSKPQTTLNSFRENNQKL